METGGLKDQQLDTVPTGVLLVVPNLALRIGMRSLVSAQPDFFIAAERDGAADDEEEMDADVVLAAGLTQAELRELTRINLPLLLVSDLPEDALYLAGSDLPAWGLLAGDFSEGKLVDALGSVARGLLVMEKRVMQRLFASPFLSADETEAGLDSLTPRELEVLQLTAEGMANKQIALKLEISEHTVKFHLSSIYSRLGVSSRTEAVNAGIRRGLVVI